MARIIDGSLKAVYEQIHVRSVNRGAVFRLMPAMTGPGRLFGYTVRFRDQTSRSCDGLRDCGHSGTRATGHKRTVTGYRSACSLISTNRRITAWARCC